MSNQIRGVNIDLPLTVLLTEEGSNFFIRNKRSLARYKTVDNSESFGIALTSTTPASLQRLILANYVSKIEITGTDLLSKRQEILDLSKLITYSFFYERFDSEVYSRLIQSDLVKKWNRSNPGSVIDENTKVDEKKLLSFFNKNKQDFEIIKIGIRDPVLQAIEEHKTLLPEEKEVHILMALRFIDALRPLVWFILNRFREIKEYKLLLDSVSSTLLKYLEKTNIAEYLALMILELVNHETTNNLMRSLKRCDKTKGIKPEAVMYDKELRTTLLEDLKRNDENLYIDWKIRSTGSSIGTQNRLQITLYNHLSEYQSLRESINTKKILDIKERSLEDFYKDLHDPVAGTELGLYYLSYLSDACDKVGIRFESSVNQVASKDLTVIALTFVF